MIIHKKKQHHESKKTATIDEITAFVLLLMFISQCPIVEAKQKSPKPFDVDPIKESLLLESDIFHISQAPSEVPSSSPSLYPSSIPTSQPSISFSNNPSYLPSISPTAFHSSEPSNMPSMVPSIQPPVYPSIEPSIPPYTSSPIELYPLGYVPDIDDPVSTAYFNYNPNDINYGPGLPRENIYYYNETQEEIIVIDRELMTTNKTITKNYTYVEYEGNAWSNVKDPYEENYWEKFHLNRTFGNRCSSSDPKRTQSPIDLCESHVNSECYEHHQIRNRVSLLMSFEVSLQLCIIL